jgi:hypothetical protein
MNRLTRNDVRWENHTHRRPAVLTLFKQKLPVEGAGALDKLVEAPAAPFTRRIVFDSRLDPAVVGLVDADGN